MIEGLAALVVAGVASKATRPRRATPPPAPSSEPGESYSRDDLRRDAKEVGAEFCSEFGGGEKLCSFGGWTTDTLVVGPATWYVGGIVDGFKQTYRKLKFW